MPSLHTQHSAAGAARSPLPSHALLAPAPCPQAASAASRVQLKLDLHEGVRLQAFSELLQLEEEAVQDAWLLLESRAGDASVSCEVRRPAA